MVAGEVAQDSERAPGRADGRQRRWDRHNRERRQHLIEAAIAEIEAVEPGVEVHVQQIARRAGVGRTVVYRHFEDRADLDRAVQTAVIDDLVARLVAEVSLDGTIFEIIRRVVGTYVDWAAEHPSLHQVAMPIAGPSGPVEEGLGRITAQVRDVIALVLDSLRADFDDNERAAFDPLVAGVVGTVFGAVRRWALDEHPAPPAAVLTVLVSNSVWYLLDGHARALGIELARDQRVEELLSSQEGSA